LDDVFTAKKPLISSRLAIMDPPGDIIVGTCKTEGQSTAKYKVKVLLSRKSKYCQLKNEVLPWIKES
ncbi:hypothetical protein Tco_0480028, partial [Tanacetum coccineum]